MTDYSAVDKSSSISNESDCIQAELMAEEETNPGVTYEPGESSLAALDSPLEATESFAFSFIDRPVPQSKESPTSTEELFARLFTPWSLVGLLMLVAANGLLTIYGLTARVPGPAMTVANFDGLPPIPPSLPPVAEVSPRLNLQKLSEVVVVREPEQSIPRSPQAIAHQNPSVSSPPAMIPPAQPVPMAGYSPYLNDPRYVAAGSGPIISPRPSQSGSPLPTIAIQPIRQAPTPPLPPPPPPPISAGMGSAIAPPPPVAQANYATQNANVSGSATPAGGDVQSQIYQQLPNATAPGPATGGGEGQSFNQKTRQQLTRIYNQGGSTADAGTSPATQQLVQELESLNQAPY
ncbi:MULTISPECIES: hypothetical protein [unclassified Synechocystis]|uniref:hypothetical protein n=2 Tax=Cyanophyceae TaxID=3028117 RepID=UPI00048ED4B7|nr:MULTISPECIES: hypothetical protein [unclassified Synechocystis]MCT0253141.1 hypothetical protein [Synechocystis sp. CS-94]